MWNIHADVLKKNTDVKIITVYLYYLITYLCINYIFMETTSWTDILLCMLLIVVPNFPPRLLKPPELKMKTTVYCSSWRIKRTLATRSAVFHGVVINIVIN